MTIAEERLAALLAEYERVFLNDATAPELMLFELTRALDTAAHAITFGSDGDDYRARTRRRLRMLGAATALRPLTQVLRGTSRGVPAPTTDTQFSEEMDRHLLNCGIFAHVGRLLSMERHGLSSTSFVSSNHLVIEVAHDEADRREADALRELQDSIADDDALLAESLIPTEPKLARRLDSYVGVDRNNFIRYDNDDELVEYYRALALRRAARFFEGEALPLDATIGGRTFEEWRRAAASAGGRALQHIAFASRLSARHPSLPFRNMLTIFARNEDVAEVLRSDGEPDAQVAVLLRAMTLDEPAATLCIAEHEVPFPFYIAFGRDFVLLPSFGSLLNPLAGTVRFLRANYRRDWDSAVARREEVFRADIRELLQEPRFAVSPRGSTLRRPDGSVLTDIDAVVVDRKYGTLALFQLKWPDVHARSLRERESRRRNLLAAIEWVDRVSGWIEGRSAAAIAKELQLGDVSDHGAPRIFVMSRYAARFEGNAPYDARAAWFGWADFVRATRSHADTDIFGWLDRTYRDGSMMTTARGHEWADSTFRFESLRVDVHIR